MSGIAPLVAALDSLERVQAELAAISRRIDPERRNDLVRLRRALSNEVALIGELAESAFADHPGVHDAFRRHFSAMRSATALHQAEWPAVRLGEVEEGYRQSALVVRQKNHFFATWLRSTIAELALSP